MCRVCLRTAYCIGGLILTAAVISALVGYAIGPSIVHPMNLNPNRAAQVEEMLGRRATAREDFSVRAADGAELRGWKVRARSPNGNWIILFHGVSDNRSGVLGYAELLLRHGYNVVMMDSRAHGESTGDMATYGWKERYDTVVTTDGLYSTETVTHLGAMGVSMGAAIALQSAAVDPRIEAVVAEDPFADLHEVLYDYAGLRFSPLLGKTLFRPATILAIDAIENVGGFSAADVSPVRAVTTRPFPILLICGTRDRTIPCRHAKRIY